MLVDRLACGLHRIPELLRGRRQLRCAVLQPLDVGARRFRSSPCAPRAFGLAPVTCKPGLGVAEKDGQLTVDERQVVQLCGIRAREHGGDLVGVVRLRIALPDRSLPDTERLSTTHGRFCPFGVPAD
ncbi:hypothetical protein ACFVH6_36045 [Spirillospora sp. NPDC127200]